MTIAELTSVNADRGDVLQRMEYLEARLQYLEERVARQATEGPAPMKVVMTPEVAAKLRAPFTPDQIRYKPNSWCKACSNAPRKVCGEHRKVRCPKCKTNVTDAHICIAFVGHAEVESRLLEVDPNWGWKPAVVDERGFPVLDSQGNLWINLTVAGKTVLGVGDCKGEQVTGWKPVIGDAIKNAAYRGFGIAIDLWGVAEKATEEAEALAATSEPAPVVRRISAKALREIATLREALGLATPAAEPTILRIVSSMVGAEVASLEDLTPAQGAAVIASMTKKRDELAATTAGQAAA